MAREAQQGGKGGWQGKRGGRDLQSAKTKKGGTPARLQISVW